jgi:hypothetical protein
MGDSSIAGKRSSASPYAQMVYDMSIGKIEITDWSPKTVLVFSEVPPEGMDRCAKILPQAVNLETRVAAPNPMATCANFVAAAR